MKIPKPFNKKTQDLTVEHLKNYYQVKPWTPTERQLREKLPGVL